jgi:5-methylcytosine-specific restriction endonuclease McrA
MSRIPDALRILVRERAGYRCEYCQASEWLAGQRFYVDHIIPLAEGGISTEDNLCLACPMCNGSKLSRMDGIDPETGKRSSLFHPRRQAWAEHFMWSEDGLIALGLTP